MIQISDDQLSALEEGRLGEFCEKLAVRARDRHGAACDDWTDPELIELMRGEVKFARSHDLRTRRLLERYVDVSVAVGFGYGESADWASEVLNGSGKPEEKVTGLEETAVFVVRGG